MNSLRPLILITPCIMPRLLWTCLRISYPRSYQYHAIICTKVKNKISTVITREVFFVWIKLNFLMIIWLLGKLTTQPNWSLKNEILCWTKKTSSVIR
jgi:hypothetical protein